MSHFTDQLKFPRRICITRYSRAGTYYAPGMFQGSVGKKFSVSGGAPEWAQGILVGFKIHEGGQGVDLTIELPDK